MLTKTLVALLIVAGAHSAHCQQPALAPDAVFTGATGKVELKDYRGKRAVVLLFMRGFAEGMTCYYCGEQTRAYRAAYPKLQAAGAEVIMVLPLAKDIAGYIKKIGADSSPSEPNLTLPFPVVLDADGSACKAFAVPTKEKGGTDPFPVAAPATIVIGKDGHVLFEQHGQDPSDRPEVDAVLEVLRTGVAKPATAKPVAAVAPQRAWSTYADGMAAAKAQRRPILLEFHAVW
jgi:peroxiredoxin